ncbi:MAG: PqqD family protein [Rikenellaceae bacterium]
MKIDNSYKVRSIADQSVVILQGKHGADTTKVLQFNNTSLWLWNRFKDESSFTLECVKESLMEHYSIDAELAEQDAKQWIEALREYNVVSE